MITATSEPGPGVTITEKKPSPDAPPRQGPQPLQGAPDAVRLMIANKMVQKLQGQIAGLATRCAELEVANDLLAEQVNTLTAALQKA